MNDPRCVVFLLLAISIKLILGAPDGPYGPFPGDGRYPPGGGVVIRQSTFTRTTSTGGSGWHAPPPGWDAPSPGWDDPPHPPPPPQWYVQAQAGHRPPPPPPVQQFRVGFPSNFHHQTSEESSEESSLLQGDMTQGHMTHVTYQATTYPGGPGGGPVHAGYRPVHASQRPPSAQAVQPGKPLQDDDEGCNWCLRQRCSQGGCQDAPNFNARQDAMTISIAIRNKNEAQVAEILTQRSERQRKSIQLEWPDESTLEAELEKSNFKSKKLLLALLKPRTAFYVEELHTAFEKKNIDKIIMILTSLSQCALRKVKLKYNKLYKKFDLKEAIEVNSMFKFEDFLLNLASGQRAEEGPINQVDVDKDVQELATSDPGKWVGKEDNVFSEIFTKRSYSHLRAVISKYNKEAEPKNTNLEKDIQTKANGNIRRGLLALLQNIQDQPKYFAEELKSSMTESGFKDEDKVVFIMRGRCGIDLGDIRNAYPSTDKNTQLMDKFTQIKQVDYLYREALKGIVKGTWNASMDQATQANGQVTSTPGKVEVTVEEKPKAAS